MKANSVHIRRFERSERYRFPSVSMKAGKQSPLSGKDASGLGGNLHHPKITISLSVSPYLPKRIRAGPRLGQLIAGAAHPLAGATQRASGDLEGLVRINADSRKVYKISSIEDLSGVQGGPNTGNLSPRDHDAVNQDIPGIASQNVPTRRVRPTVVRREPDNSICKLWRQNPQSGERVALWNLGFCHGEHHRESQRTRGKDGDLHFDLADSTFNRKRKVLRQGN
jgi:hypothetical protein